MNVFVSPRFRLGWILILIGLVNAIYWTAYRWNYENHFNKAQITLDYEDTRLLAAAFGVPHKELLKQFHDAGATSLAVYEQSLSNLQAAGRISITPREEAERLYPKADWKGVPDDYRYLVSSTDGDLLARIKPRLVEQAADIKPRSLILREARSADDSLPFGLLIPASRELITDAVVGYDPQHIKMLHDLGYTMTARISNPLNLNPDRLAKILDETVAVREDKKMPVPVNVVIFSEDEVLGYESLMTTAAREMRKRNLLFSNIEFSKQRGADDFAKNSDGMLARVHSVSGDEAAKAKVEVVVDRYVRAAKERDIRVLYVRLLRQVKGEVKPLPLESAATQLPELEKTAYQQNLDFIKEVSSELQSPTPLVPFLRPPMQMGTAQPFGDYPMAQLTAQHGASTAKILRFLMLFLTGLGVVGATLLLINLFFDLSGSARLVWLVIGVLFVGVLSLSAGMGAKLMALQAGWTVPTVALLWGGLPVLWDGTRRLDGKLSVGRVTWYALGFLVKTTLLTLIGGLFVVAFLNNWKYMSKADEFLGEKATQFLPLLIVPLAFAGDLFPHRVEERGATAGRQQIGARFRKILQQPFTFQVAIVSLLVLVAGYIWMARFGNESGMEISTFELKLRATLEKLFITRPRTKEIFLGHPAFIFAVYFMLRRQRGLAFCALVAAVIGQTDALNSMCHIHTPVFYCIWRTITGVVLGTLVGFFALAVYDAVLGRRQTLPQPGLNGNGPGNVSLTAERVA